jgi:hypothetical protein
MKPRKKCREIVKLVSCVVANASAHRIAIDQKLNEKFFH